MVGKNGRRIVATALYSLRGKLVHANGVKDQQHRTPKVTRKRVNRMEGKRESKRENRVGGMVGEYLPRRGWRGETRRGELRYK